MSTLLHSVLTARLANAKLDGSDIPLSEDWESVGGSLGESSDEELVGVVSLPGTAPGTPRSSSRPSSPPPGSSSPAPGASAKPHIRSTLSSASKSKKSKTDPLRSLPSELSQRIFLQLSIPDLLSCSLVCRRWRRSATINYAWYRHYHLTSFAEGHGALPALGEGAKWTRRESKTDWKAAHAKQRRLQIREMERSDSMPGSGSATPSRTQRLADAGLQTTREAREAQWNEENSGTYTKHEMREHYKSLGNKGGKVKGKSGKGGIKTGSANDASALWE